MTFTEAAASEMKERIRTAIEKELEAHPDSMHLQRQATLIHSAQVTTIHSFCLSVIREYFHTIDLDPGFRIGEEGELKLLKRDVVENLLEEAFESGKPEFLNFVESFATGQSLTLKIFLTTLEFSSTPISATTLSPFFIDLSIIKSFETKCPQCIGPHLAS